MALSVTPAIPASRIVDVIPSVLPAGGNALDLIGLILDGSGRIPLGTVLQFATGADVDDYFGTLTQQSALGSIYFLGYDNSTVKPAKILFAGYNETDAAAWLRGGDITSLTLAELQAIIGTLSISIDGTPHSATINLSSATSFSNAAELLGSQLGILGHLDASVTASINNGAAAFTASITSNLMTVTAMSSGKIYPGSTLAGTGGGGVATGTTVLQQLSGTVGGTGVYQVSISQTLASTAVTAARTDGVLDVTNLAQGGVIVGDVIIGSGVTSNTFVTGFLTGTGGNGSYSVSISGTVGSENMLLYQPAVQFDSVSGAFVVYSPTLGITSSIGFATGTASATLRLTEAEGAVTSQGAAAANPITFMDDIISVTTDWVSFMTTFEPSEANKILFATWTNTQRNRYMYAMWDTQTANTGAGGPSTAVHTINTNGYSGIAMIHEDPDIDTTGGELSAFLLGAVASLDTARTNGRATMAFRKQAGLAPEIFNATEADYLISYGLNFYGDYTTANQAFTWFYPGSVSGDFLWIDSYVNQIWLNNQLQLALMVLLESVGSIPYNVAGYGLIEAACLDPINAGVNFGAIRPGVTLSAAQIAEVNSAAGLKIDTTLSARGWYLQILDASPQVRAARGSPPMTLWYMDGQSVQRIQLASIEVQ